MNNTTITGLRRLSVRTVETSATSEALPRVSDGLDFNNREAVAAERRRLAATPALAALCGQVQFNGDAQELIPGLVAMLMVNDAADAHQHSTPEFEEIRRGTLELLAESLSPVGQDELLQTLNANGGRYVLSDYLPDADGLGLAAHICFAQARAAGSPESALRAAEVCESAANAYLQKNAPGPAAQMYKMAAGCFAAAGLDKQSVEAATKAGDNFMQVNMLSDAAEVYDKTASECVKISPKFPDDGFNEKAEATFSKAAAAHCLIAAGHRQAGDSLKSVQDAYGKAVHAYACAKQYTLAAGAHVSTAEFELQRDAPGSAACSYRDAVSCYLAAEEYELGAQVHEQFMKICQELPLNELRSIEYTKAAAAWAESDAPGKHLHMTAAYLAAVEINMRHRQYSEAGKNLDKAVTAWGARDVSSTPLNKVGDVRETFLKIAQAATHSWRHALAADALTGAGQDLAAASAWHRAAEVSLRNGDFGAAARAHGNEGECLMVAGQYKRAKTAFEKAEQAYARVGARDQANQARVMAEAADRFASSSIGSADDYD